MRPRVFLDFSLGEQDIGRVICELYNDTAPKTAENFRALCTGEKGLSESGHALYYKNSVIHRSIDNFMIQGGDLVKRNGAGMPLSIYGGFFDDEDLTRPLDAEGLLCMANKGPNTNGSQFFITLRECPHLNGKHVVFGRVLKGYDDVVKRIAQVPVDEKNRPKVPVVIHNCGELERRVRSAKELTPEPEESEIDEDDEEGRKKRPRTHSRSASPKRHQHHRHKKSKHQKEQRRDSADRENASLPDGPRKETEEEYDARLEREENERKATARNAELDRLRSRYERHEGEPQVRLKGRGAMLFVDPETNWRR